MADGDTAERYGTVLLHDGQWLTGPDGRLARGFVGALELHKDEEVLGFTTNARATADWFVTIAGETMRLHLFGCQVRAILEHARDVEPPAEVCRIP